ncbi:MAG: hypothetical protein ACRER5_04590 [Pseudomonas sp.]
MTESVRYLQIQPSYQHLQVAFLKAVFADRVGHVRSLAEQLADLYPDTWPATRSDAMRQAIVRRDPIMCALMLELGEVVPAIMALRSHDHAAH